ncbi:hypothetical protein Y013_23380 [Rhodococcus pyridinivorans SB3094]|uniref:Uncharacterized protein n=1 Tax=Rhodococcus pyridinivorans SB3094 TaxID=1435356 RepID=V9XPF4_9NOCA|nr:hypothetical protein Y013_23380 [Rhodococcus pyridinivorans SB3094]
MPAVIATATAVTAHAVRLIAMIVLLDSVFVLVTGNFGARR